MSMMRADGTIAPVPKMVLPADFADRLRGMYSPGKPSWRFAVVAAAAHNAGWTLQSIADAVGITRERIRQITNDVYRSGYIPQGYDVPPVPVKPVPVKPQKPRLTEEQAAYLRQLNTRAKATGLMRRDDPRVVAGRELAALLHRYTVLGHTLVELAAACGVTKTSIVFRLGRYGYRSLPPTQRFGPGPATVRLDEDEEEQL
jgi:hypothetical protein